MATENEHVILREARKEDAPTLVRLMHAAFDEYKNVLDPPSAAHAETVQTVQKRLAAGSAAIALVGGEPAGFAFYEPRGTHLYFSRLSVLPEFRNRGVGRALIQYVERRARETGRAGVRLGVRLQLPHLVARYERLGYRITEYVAHPGYTDPTFVFMEKPSELKAES
jgi:ribosomal protein S18 acetylase RimI-like enzyme